MVPPGARVGRRAGLQKAAQGAVRLQLMLISMNKKYEASGATKEAKRREALAGRSQVQGYRTTLSPETR